jgi:hypothetical protein
MSQVQYPQIKAMLQVQSEEGKLYLTLFKEYKEKVKSARSWSGLQGHWTVKRRKLEC